jgi:hypothetical protein
VIGDAEIVPINDASAKAAEILAEVEAGKDPHAARQAQRKGDAKAETFNEAQTRPVDDVNLGGRGG